MTTSAERKNMRKVLVEEAGMVKKDLKKLSRAELLRTYKTYLEEQESSESSESSESEDQRVGRYLCLNYFATHSAYERIKEIVKNFNDAKNALVTHAKQTGTTEFVIDTDEYKGSVNFTVSKIMRVDNSLIPSDIRESCKREGQMWRIAQRYTKL